MSNLVDARKQKMELEEELLLEVVLQVGERIFQALRAKGRFGSVSGSARVFIEWRAVKMRECSDIRNSRSGKSAAMLSLQC
jgi:hypothetical protein